MPERERAQVMLPPLRRHAMPLPFSFHADVTLAIFYLFFIEAIFDAAYAEFTLLLLMPPPCYIRCFSP